MRSHRTWVVALAMVGLVCVSTGAASAPLGGFVQGELELDILDMDGCAEGILYSVPNGKRLVIEYVSIETAGFADTSYAPVLVEAMTWLNGVQITHELARVEEAKICAVCFIGRGTTSKQVTLYNQANRSVRIRACRNTDFDVTSVTVTFHGRLFPG